MLACSVLAILGAFIFRIHLTGQGIFIGDSDRLNTFLNLCKFNVENLKGGRLPAWNELMFMGFGMYGLPTFPCPNAFVEALFPVQALYRIAGYLSFGLFVLAGWSAYAFIKHVCRHAFSAFVGSALCMFSAFSVLKISQDDSTFLVLIYMPWMLVILRRLNRANMPGSFLGLTLLTVFMLYFSFLQMLAYALILIGAYAAYRGYRVRDWRLPVVLGAAIFVATVIAVPRLYTIVQDLPLADRTAPGHDIRDFKGLYAFQGIRSREFFRWFNDGIFGRFPGEAWALGNNINLHEGLNLYTSTSATLLILFGLVGFRGGWLRLWRLKEGDAPFHLLFLIVVFAVVLTKPGLHLFYLLFLKIDFTHARFVLAGLVPVCTLAALLVRELARAALPHLPMRTRSAVLLAAAVLGIGVYWATGALAAQVREPNKILLNEPLLRLARSSLRLLVNDHAKIFTPSVPRDLVVAHPEPTIVMLSWRDGAGESSYHVEMKHADRFGEIGSTGQNANRYQINDVSPDASYSFRLRACWLENCSSFSPEVTIGPFLPGAKPPRLHARADFTMSWMSKRELLRVVWTAVAFALLLTTFFATKRIPVVRWLLAHCIGWIMVWEASAYADFQINGSQTRIREIPFYENNFLVAQREDFRPPTEQAVMAIRERVETERFRSVVVCDPKKFPAFCGPHLSQFWRVRLVEGYPVGVPKGLAALPWPEGVRSLRALSFPSVERLPWPLLSLLNVKYAIDVNLAFYLNDATTSQHPGPAQNVPIRSNPLPVVPRHFLVESVRPVQSIEEAGDLLKALFSPEPRAHDVVKQSLVEGFPFSTRFSASGSLDVTYEGDVITIRVEPSSEARFLVLNELYHPRWKAFADRSELKIFRTNLVMRGVVIPAGTSRLELRFIPFIHTGVALFILVCGIALLAGGWGLFRLKAGSLNLPARES
ncbi:MAG TPA: fibronectin type III domain-containing protein [Methylomirabilota bacterium]|nr:fibronectin type III domain-containing protein [Methylomirabilota bacterium]